MNQKEVLDILKLGVNVFLTGPAGSGKTFVINKYIEYLKTKGIKAGVTASTGIAATHINGITIHSWSGIGINRELSKKEFNKLLKKRYLIKRFRETNVLVIDEISMLDSARLDLVNRVSQAFNTTTLPFGGMQIILCGDFFQLPPVDRGGGGNNFAFKSEIWREMNLSTCYLDEQHRHKDKKYFRVLNCIRNREVDKDSMSDLKSCMKKAPDEEITKLYTKNREVDSINNDRLNRINSESRVYEMQEKCKLGREKLLVFLKKNSLARERLELKIGAVVMFLKNKFDQNERPVYVNGTLGKVVGFEEIAGLPIVRLSSGREVIADRASWTVDEDNEVLAAITQVPLCLAWAITVHKSQGMSLDRAAIDLSEAFEYGMGYVALSRVRSLNGVKLLGINRQALEVNPEIAGLDKQFKRDSRKVSREYAKLEGSMKQERQEQFVDNVKGATRDNLFDGIFN